jgi:CHAT domain-containing protein
VALAFSVLRSTLVTAVVYLMIASAGRADSPTDPSGYMQQGLQAFQRGHFAQAIQSWRHAVNQYTAMHQSAAQCNALTHLAQAYQALGHYKKAQVSLKHAHTLALQANDRTQLAVILGSLCNIYVAIGPPEHAEKPLQSAEQCFRYTSSLAAELGQVALAATLSNNLGNWWISQAQPRAALATYLESAELAQQASRPDLAARARINAAVAATQTGQYAQAEALLDAAQTQMDDIPLNHQKAEDLNKMGIAYHDLCQQLYLCRDELIVHASDALTKAANIAQRLDDARTLSYAWGYLGHLYETQQHRAEALLLTRRAMTAARRVHAPESLYRWQWQAGRLLNAQGDVEAAATSYRHAIATLQSIRRELSHSYGQSPTTFRDATGRLYFECVDLLLQISGTQDAHHKTRYLREARDTVELFKAAELRDYFRDECVDAAQAAPTPLDQFTHTAIIIYPIILPDRLELLVSLPHGLRRYTVAVPSQRLERVVRSFRVSLQGGKVQRYMRHAQRLYNWLVKPLEADLARTEIKTLVFVPDGVLRLIPLAALHDGEHFIIQRYALAITPALALTDPKPLQRRNLEVLTMGLTKAVQGFASLPHVLEEVTTIQKLYDGTQLLNEDFLVDRIEHTLQTGDFGIIHIASHSRFASDVDQSFILTFDDKLTMDRLETLIGRLRYRETPLELLILSACETAMGDDQAALGLAGIAIKAGARSALATLWQVADDATSVLIQEFYRQLQQQSISRAQALQQAQLKLLADSRYQSPFFWSPFLLINNWL